MVLVFAEKFADLALWIVEISKVHTMGRANRYTGGVFPLLDTVNAERALVRVAIWVDEAGIVRTRCKTGFTTDTFIVVDENHATSLVNMTGACWAAIDAGWIRAVVTPLGANFHTEVREFPFHGRGNPVAAVAFWDVIFCFTCNDAIHASYTSFGINDHSVSSHNYSPVSKVTKLTFIPVPPIMGSVLYLVTKVASDAPFPKAFFSPRAL